MKFKKMFYHMLYKPTGDSDISSLKVLMKYIYICTCIIHMANPINRNELLNIIIIVDSEISGKK